MKKYLSVLLGICLAFCFVSCKKAESKPAETGKSTQQTTEKTDKPLLADGSHQAKTIAADCCFVAIREDGTVAESGCDQCDTSGWTDIVQVVASGSSVIGLKNDGTVVTTSDYDKYLEIGGWDNIVRIAGGTYHIVGLKADGTVVSTSLEENSGANFGQTEVSDWTDIVAISASGHNTVGLKADGTVVAAGIAHTKVANNVDLIGVRFNEDADTMISNWTDIVAISASDGFTAGLKSDGTVVLAGDIEGLEEVNDWKNIVAIDANDYYLVGLKADGTPIATHTDLSHLGSGYVSIDDGKIGTILINANGELSYTYVSSENVDSSVFKDTVFRVK